MGELKKKIHGLKPKLYPARQRLTLPPKAGAKSGEVLKDSATIDSLGLKDGSVIIFKDLGTQVRGQERARGRAAAAGARRACGAALAREAAGDAAAAASEGGGRQQLLLERCWYHRSLQNEQVNRGPAVRPAWQQLGSRPAAALGGARAQPQQQPAAGCTSPPRPAPQSSTPAPHPHPTPRSATRRCSSSSTLAPA